MGRQCTSDVSILTRLRIIASTSLVPWLCSDKNLFHSIGLFFRHFIAVLIQLSANKICQWLDSNCGSLVLEATALPTEPPPLPEIRIRYRRCDWGRRSHRSEFSCPSRECRRRRRQTSTLLSPRKRCRRRWRWRWWRSRRWSLWRSADSSNLIKCHLTILTYFGHNLLCYWEKFHCCKWPNIEIKIQPSTYTAYLLARESS